MKKLLSVYGTCDIGCVKPNNEDMILLGEDIFRDTSRRFIFETDKTIVIAVADGIGGMEDGEVASEMTLTGLLSLVKNFGEGLTGSQIKEAFENFTKQTHLAIGERGGSTLAGLLFYEDRLYRYHAGDSRIYLLRDNELSRLTVDHSLCESGGDPTAPPNIITNSFGGGGSAFIDFAEIDPPQHKDIYLLTSDGLHDMVSFDVIRGVMKIPEEEQEEALAEKLLFLSKKAGGKDNISVITVKISNAN